MNIVNLSRLNELRHSENPIPTRTMTKHASEGTLPGAFQLKKCGQWKVDLDVYDRTMRDLIETNKQDGAEEATLQSESEILDDIYEEFTRVGQAIK